VRVAHLTTVDSSLRFLLLPQLRAIVRDGGEAVGISAGGPWLPELFEAGVKHIALQSSTRAANPAADVRSAFELWAILRRERFDVLHTHNPKPGVYGRVIGRLAGVPIVVNTNHGLFATQEDPWLKRFFVYTAEAIAARFSDGELIQSSEDLALLTRWRIVPRAKTQLLGNGVDLSRFDPGRFTPEERAATRQTLELDEGDICIGIVGRLVREKGFQELFRAMELLDDRYKLVVIGPDDPDKADALEPAMVEAARNRGVRFLGMRSDVDSLYSAFDVFVLPSHREGVPRAAMEAAAMGLPIIATNVRGCREVVEDSTNGFLVPARDPRALAGALRTLGEDASLRAAMGRAGYQRARARFDERNVVRIVMDTYQRLTLLKGTRSSETPKGEQPTSDLSGPGAPVKTSVRAPVSRPTTSVLKRTIDVAVSAPGLVALSPVIIATALSVRRSLGSPVLFIQERAGLHGKPFRLYKFRTMRDLRDADGNLLPDSVRLTRLGRFLRASSLDEIPQLLNVLKGDMSLVGPRPLLMQYLARYAPEQGRRHEVKPGITGWSQINGRNAISWDSKLELDVWYVDHWSVALDLKILALTISAILGRHGISRAGHATMPEFTGPSLLERSTEAPRGEDGDGMTPA
jgi:lipopolysaccharide/colanic/teichoic acid biosynthesis glycosyltransferase/glycosyltransferase involved in cell wall biosynthesis